LVQPEQQTDLTNTVREQREQLAELRRELASRSAPLSPLEARLIVELADARLKAVEDALRHEMLGRTLFRRFLGRVRRWARPRIGILRQYQPKPLLVPAKYMLAVPPDPAPTISIVTPSFRQGRFLERTLYSVVSQGYPSLEYVVQDGGSSDETVAVLRRFERLLTAWRSEPDGGQADAINRGFGQTTGEIMGWLNSDDLLLPGTLAYVAAYFASHPNVDVVYGHRLMIDENDGQIGAWILPAHDDVVLTYADYVPQETLFWRRRLWEAVGGSVDPSFSYALDWDLLLRFRDAGATMVRLPRFLGAFRIHDEQKTTATADVGDAECNRLRQRVHGRGISAEEIRLRMRPYYVRHILIHKRQRIVDRLPLRRHPVRTVPDESWLMARELERRSLELQRSESGEPTADSLIATSGDAIVARGRI
jgi:glycosyltransferase involved in cell wall biosynthesis